MELKRKRLLEPFFIPLTHTTAYHKKKDEINSLPLTLT